MAGNIPAFLLGYTLIFILAIIIVILPDAEAEYGRIEQENGGRIQTF